VICSLAVYAIQVIGLGLEKEKVEKEKPRQSNTIIHDNVRYTFPDLLRGTNTQPPPLIQNTYAPRTAKASLPPQVIRVCKITTSANSHIISREYRPDQHYAQADECAYWMMRRGARSLKARRTHPQWWTLSSDEENGVQSLCWVGGVIRPPHRLYVVIRNVTMATSLPILIAKSFSSGRRR
jgi:hypothetical protein